MLLWKRRENAAGASSRPPSWARLPAGQTRSVLRIRIGSLRIRIQQFFLSIWIRIQIQIQGFGDQNWKKFTAENFFYISKLATYLSLGLHKERLSFNRSLHPSKENIWHFKTWGFFTFVGNLALLDPDPYFQCRSGSGSSWPKWMRIRADPDLDSQHWTQFLFCIFDLLRRVLLCIWNNLYLIFWRFICGWIL